jgi:hypothetical protein
MRHSLISPTVPIVVAVLSLGICVYQYVEIGRLHARIARVAEAPVKARDCSAAFEMRLPALEPGAARMSSASPAPARPGAAEPGHEAVGPGDSPAPPAAQRGLPRALADQALMHETTRKLLDAARARSLDLEDNRRTWIQELATAEGLSPDKMAQLGRVFEAEFQRRNEVIAEVKSGIRTRKDGRAELQRLEAASNERARAALGAGLFEKYLARRVASGIHDDGSAN